MADPAGSSDFSSNPRRDAWKTIRGFVQQVRLTILRWLDLPDDHTLELERGEDIDQIADQIGSAPSQRLLEQIKVSQANITLRAAGSIEAIANFAEHRQKNPGVPLVMRLTTTADRGMERPPVVQGRAGIDIWEDLAGIQSTPQLSADQESALTALREAVASLVQPEGFSNDTWAVFRAFIQGADNNTFHEFLRHVEWSTSVPLGDDFDAEIREKLIARGVAADLEHARQMADRLFVYVFRLLTQKGLKRLTAADLKALVAQPTLTESDHQLLAVVKATLDDLGLRVSLLETQVAAGTVAAIAKQQGIEATLIATVDLAVLDPPAAADPLCDRGQVASDALQALGDKAWLALSGGVGSGRRQLALQLLHPLGQCPAWLRCADLSPPLAARAIEAMVVQRVATARGPDRFKLFADALQPRPVVVLQDVPPFREDDALGQKLIALAAALRAADGRLLTTSIQPPPKSVLDRYKDRIVVFEVPPPNEDEVKQWLEAAGSPDRWRHPALVRFVQVIGHANPTLISSVIRYFRDQGWALSDQQLRELAAKEHARDVHELALDLLVERVPEQASRDLLYRLNLIGASFDSDDIAALAAVEPSVDHPIERLAQLRKVCVESDNGQKSYHISAIFADLGRQDLSQETRRESHAAIARRIVKRETIDLVQLLRGIHHFTEAGNPSQAAALLTMGLEASLHERVTSATVLIANIWAELETPLPDGVDASVRIILRSLQTVIRSRLRLPFEHLVQELDGRVRDAGAAQSLAVVHAWLRISIEFSFTRPELAYRYAAAAYRHLPTAKLPNGEPVPWPAVVPVEVVLFVNSGGIATAQQMDLFLDGIEAMDNAERQKAAAHDVSIQASYLMPQRVWMAEQKKPARQHDWPALLKQMEHLASRSQSLGLGLLSVSCQAARAAVLSGPGGRVDEAVELGQSALVGADTAGAVIVGQVVGDALLAKGERDRAVPFLKAAAESVPVNALYEIQSLASSALSRAWDAEPKGRALDYARRAVTFAEREPGGQVQIRALGELAVAEYLAANQAAAVSALARVGVLLRSSIGDGLVAPMVAPWSHVLGFVASAVHATKAPNYPPPQRGMFFMSHAYTLAVPPAQQLGNSAGNLALVCAHIGLGDVACDWAEFGLRFATETGDTESAARLQRWLGQNCKPRQTAG